MPRPVADGPIAGSPWPPIADYAFLSDCETTALVAPSGNIEWMCIPRMDSPSIFGAMLDRDAGMFSLAPADARVPAGTALHPGHEHARDDLGHEDRLADRPRRAPRRPLAPRPRALAHAPPLADGLRRRARPAAHAALRQRDGQRPHGVRPDLRLRARAGEMGVRGRGLRGVPRDVRRSRSHAEPAERPAARHRGLDRARAHDDARRRRRLRRAELERAQGPGVLRGRLQAARAHGRLLARMARPGRVPRPSLARLPAAQRADAEGSRLRADRCDVRRRHDVAARDARRRAQLGLPLLLGARLDVHALGALHARLRLGGRRLLRVHRRGLRRRRPAGHVRDRRRAPARRGGASPSRATSTRDRCGSATTPTTTSSTTSGAARWTRSTCTRSRATGCARRTGRCCASRSRRRSRTGASPIAASGRCAATRSTSRPRRSCAGWRSTAAHGWRGCARTPRRSSAGRRWRTRSRPTCSSAASTSAAC